MADYDYITIEPAREPLRGVSVYGFGVYPPRSSLEGQTMKRYLGGYATEAEARAVYPEAEAEIQFRDPCNYFNHLPGEDDPVPGGMYPDDY